MDATELAKEIVKLSGQVHNPVFERPDEEPEHRFFDEEPDVVEVSYPTLPGICARFLTWGGDWKFRVYSSQHLLLGIIFGSEGVKNFRNPKRFTHGAFLLPCLIGGQVEGMPYVAEHTFGDSWAGTKLERVIEGPKVGVIRPELMGLSYSDQLIETFNFDMMSDLHKAHGIRQWLGWRDWIRETLSGQREDEKQPQDLVRLLSALSLHMIATRNF